VADIANLSVRRISLSGNVTKISSTSMTLDNDGNIYMTDTRNHVIRKIGRDGRVETFIGPASISRLMLPYGIVFGPDRSLYIADNSGRTIKRISLQNSFLNFVREYLRRNAQCSGIIKMVIYNFDNTFQTELPTDPYLLPQPKHPTCVKFRGTV
jgi:hypothetical protein